MPLKQFDLDWWLLKMSEDFSAQQPIAIWNHARGVWEKPETENILCGHLEPYSETWQPSGTMRNGRVYGRPTPAHPINDSESSSLPTPRSRDWKNQAATAETALGRLDRGYGLDIAETIALLRTPAASEAERGHQPEDKARARGGQVTLSGQTNFSNDFGRFTPAIQRWEKVISRDAPAPTKPDGRDGQHRLSSEFTEWMMGLPKGWITGHGLSRKDELKACGNGVVPQQAELALKILLKKVAD